MTKSVIFCEIRFLQVYVTVLEISILKLVKFRIWSPVMLSICLHTFLNDVLSFRANYQCIRKHAQTAFTKYNK